MDNPSFNLLKAAAFTVIELVLVIIVLGILIGISVPKIKGFQQNSNLVKASKEVATIMTALESYYTFNSHSFPVSTTPITNLQATYLINATPNIISSILYDPFAAAGTEYSYASSSNGQYYVVWSQAPGRNLPTGITNTGDITY